MSTNNTLSRVGKVMHQIPMDESFTLNW